MSLLLNDLSFHGQFQDTLSFKSAIGRLMAIRQTATAFGRELQCHRNVANALVMPGTRMQQAIQMLGISEQRVLRSWLTKNGPFWEDVRNHAADEYLEYNGSVVTDTAIGEAAWCGLNSIDRIIVSIAPSDWQFSPLPVEWMSSDGTKKSFDVTNHWENHTVEAFLKETPIPISTWHQLANLAPARYPSLKFCDDAFDPLSGHPFVQSAAQRVLSLLEILNKFQCCFDADGKRTAEGHEIYQNFFTGVKAGGGHGATFSDSSDSEKNEFEKELTFAHPEEADKNIFCTWHGKIQTPQLRVHFSWPIRAEEPLYIAYVGPKITKR